MGSPENYYGVFGMTRGLTSTTEDTITTPKTDLGWTCGTSSNWSATSCAGRVPTVSGSGSWTASASPPGNNLNVASRTNNNGYAQTSTNTAQQEWSGFGAQSAIPTPGAGESVEIRGLQVRVRDAFLASSCSSARIGVQLSWGSGAAGTWSNTVYVPTTGSLGTGASPSPYTVGDAASTSVWGSHTWTRDELSDTDFIDSA